MNGVEILATEEIATKFVFNWIACWIAFGVIFCMFLVAGFIVGLNEETYGFLLVGIILGALFGALFGNAFATSVVYQTQYKVTISDEVLMNEFLEKYEIIGQEGKIYTVRERNINETPQ